MAVKDNAVARTRAFVGRLITLRLSGTGTVPRGHVFLECHRMSPAAVCGHPVGADGGGSVACTGIMTRSCDPSTNL